MTPLIRNRAVEAGWPKEVAFRMSMIRTANGLGVHVDESVRQQAEDLEYGSPTSSPRSALAMLHSPQMKKEVASISKNSMDELLERMRGLFS